MEQGELGRTPLEKCTYKKSSSAKRVHRANYCSEKGYVEAITLSKKGT